MVGVEKIKGLRYDTEYVSLNSYDASSGFPQPLIVNEKHSFHTYAGHRSNKEFALFGYLSVCDWLWFFRFVFPGGEKLYGMRSLSSIYASLGTPFIEVRKSESGYQFSEVRGSYIIPTQVEACLQCSLLESGLLSHRATFQLIPRLENVGRISEYLPADCALGESVSIMFDLRKILREYFRFLLPWPKKNNNVMRHHVNHMVQYFAFFSAEFVSVYYGDKVYRNSHEVSPSSGTVRVTRNPNLKFLRSQTILEGLDKVMEAVPVWMVEMRKWVRVFTWLDFFIFFFLGKKLRCSYYCPSKIILLN